MKLKDILERHEPICSDEHIIIVDENLNILERLTNQQPSLYEECEFLNFFVNENAVVLVIYNDDEN